MMNTLHGCTCTIILAATPNRRVSLLLNGLLPTISSDGPSGDQHHLFLRIADDRLAAMLLVDHADIVFLIL